MFARRWASSTATDALEIPTADVCIVPWKTFRPGANFVTCSYVDNSGTSPISCSHISLKTLRVKWQMSSIGRPGTSTKDKTMLF
jgi:hypothetical protein